MRPAYLIDAALAIFERDVSKGLYESRGIPTIITEEEHLTVSSTVSSRFTGFMLRNYKRGI